MECLIPLLNYIKEMNNNKEDKSENVENSNKINSNTSNQYSSKLFLDLNNRSIPFENKNSNIDHYSNSVSQLLLELLKNSNGNNSSDMTSQMSHQAQNISFDFLNSTSLVNELIKLEQQNKFQIELIKRLIQNKQQNINYVNNILENFITQNSDGKEQENHTTKSSTKSNFKILDDNQHFLNLLEENKDTYASLLGKKTPREKKQNIVCGHMEKKHYAKGMCNNCYHLLGRDKKAWKCEHTNKTLYALGVCQNCYQNTYMKKLKKGTISEKRIYLELSDNQEESQLDYVKEEEHNTKI